MGRIEQATDAPVPPLRCTARDASGPLSSSETVTISTPRGCSSLRSACHPGRSKRAASIGRPGDDHYLLAPQRRQPELVPSMSSSTSSGASAVTSARPLTDSGPSAHMLCASSCTSAMPSRSAASVELEAVGSGTHTVALAGAFGFDFPSGRCVERQRRHGRVLKNHERDTSRSPNAYTGPTWYDEQCYASALCLFLVEAQLQIGHSVRSWRKAGQCSRPKKMICR